jgi:hypothetical protein
VRSAADGFSALLALRSEIPDVLISDLNMPEMSGFELLAVVRHRFPSVHTIAMSGEFPWDGAPSSLTVDAFYQKGMGIRGLLEILETLLPPNLPLPRRSKSEALTPAPQRQDRRSDDADILFACAECLPTLPQTLSNSCSQVSEADCFYCRTSTSHAALKSIGRDLRAGFPQRSNQKTYQEPSNPFHISPRQNRELSRCKP